MVDSLLEKIEIISDERNELFRFWCLHQKELVYAEKLLNRLGYEFQNIVVFLEALTHRSAISDFVTRNNSGENVSLCWNERLEFLGDSALNLVMTTMLWEQFPDGSEGTLSKSRAALVNERTLAKIGMQIKLDRCIALGVGEEKNNGRKRDSLIADALEAFLGAVYLDSGFEKVQEVIAKLYRNLMPQNIEHIDVDFKTKLQELVQADLKCTPTYEIINESGPDHLREFEVGVVIETRIVATGKGANKKRASQDAAKIALELLYESKQSRKK